MGKDIGEMNSGTGIRLLCPSCHAHLSRDESVLECGGCRRKYHISEGIPNFLKDSEQEAVTFYENWHRDPHKVYNLSGIGRVIKESPFIKKYSRFFKYLLYTQFKRERFFGTVANMLRRRYREPRILDLGCGGGNPELLNAGVLYGVDYSPTSLKHSLARQSYAMLINCNAAQLPFEAETFDCLVSSDFIGHVPPQEKEKLFSEMSRVLKKGGLCAHVIETDSDNFVKEFAKKYPDLYHRYFIEGIGGHYGLEMPAVVLQRFRAVGLQPLKVRKYYSYIWDIESFIALFDNEYRKNSILLRGVLSCYKLLSKNIATKVIATMFLGFFSYLTDLVSPLNKAEGIMVICTKTARDSGVQ